MALVLGVWYLGNSFWFQFPFVGVFRAEMCGNSFYVVRVRSILRITHRCSGLEGAVFFWQFGGWLFFLIDIRV